MSTLFVYIDTVVTVSLVLNGIYDVVCACCILYLPYSSFGRLHSHLFLRATTLSNQLLAYWVMTYGLDRIVAGIYSSPFTDVIAVLSYLVETIAFYEFSKSYQLVHAEKVRFVYTTSLCMAIMVATRRILVLVSRPRKWSTHHTVTCYVTILVWTICIFRALYILDNEGNSIRPF